MTSNLCPNVLVVIGLCLSPSSSGAESIGEAHQTPTRSIVSEPQTAPREQPSVRAVLATKPPKIDGLLDEAVWHSVPAIDNFVQQEPREGMPASDRTEVRILYDQGHLFIGVHAYASLPVIATEMRRDADRLFDEDNFQILLDTFHDSRNAFMFLTTPLGAKLEQQIFDEGEGGGRGTTANVNRNWDGVWDVAARIAKDGWTVEISIPINTLRFSKGDEQTWGINFERHIRRKNEHVFWAPVPKAYGLTRVSLAGNLTGLRGLSLGWDLKLKPFLLGGVHDVRSSATSTAISAIRDAGFDARYGVTPGLNLDVTVNTDFAQVEVDEQQLNLTRFSLFFPEKRNFFLENSNLFTVGTGSSFTSAAVQTDLFFSRRIGLSDLGIPIPIIAGVRLAGKSGSNNIGLLNVQTEEAFGKAGDNFFVGRFSRDVFKRSRVGALFVNKESVDGSAHYNRTMSVDANLAISSNIQVNSFVARTATPGFAGKDMAFYGRFAFRDPRWNVWLNYLDVQDHFNAEAGFVQRTGIRTTKAYFSRTPRPKRGIVKVFEPQYVLTYTADQANRLVGRLHNLALGTTLRDDSYINVIYRRNLDVLDVPFRMAPGVTIPLGNYRTHEWVLSYNTSPGRRLYSRLAFLPMEFYGGTRRQFSAAGGLRASSRWAAELQFIRNDVRLPWGDFLVNLTTARVDYAFSPRMSIRSLMQYNSSTDELSTNVRFNFIHRPGSDVYLVYSDLSQTGLPADILGKKDRQLVVKASYLIQR